MAAGRYEIYLRMLKHKKRNFVSPSDHAIFFLLCIILMFLRFSTTVGRFPKILEKFPKIAEDFRKRCEDVSIIHQHKFECSSGTKVISKMISHMHVWMKKEILSVGYRFYQFFTTRYTKFSNFNKIVSLSR